ncbi:hypothetical protein KORDIASMS9_02212 [Kordia sp. SMS9]|uniref:hypothetical protein n=1 Tax=Kordia sp. SMS9 TaxID=2282170 RepID=UPI000E0DA00D|nr:hypothetical protein [Kordia sp. SMS9]AXG69983.1 hypothetical protein KORDIASMS9_02212 [Kordia sp. SMS9]
MNFQEKLVNYLNVILNFNWETFNTLPIREQLSDWNLLFMEFDQMINEEHELNGVDFAITTAIVRMYSKHFEELPIESSLHSIINSKHIRPRLYAIILDLEFEEIQKKSTSICDCELRNRYDKKPIVKHLQKIKVLYDGYYNPMLLKCTNCNFQWISYTTDDSKGTTVFEKYIV